MNPENILVAIRYGLTAFGVSESQHYATNQWQFWVLLAVAGASFLWGQYKTLAAQQIKTVDALPQVEGVAVKPEVAGQVNSPTVTTIRDLADKLLRR